MAPCAGPLHVVWFKRDLRIVDHRPLCDAVAAAHAAGGAVVAFYIVEPGLWACPEMSGRHWAFLAEGLTELDTALHACGARLHVARGEAVAVLRDVHAARSITALHAHEETGLVWTYDRDRAVRRWAREAGVAVRESPQHGVVRRLEGRNGWARRWDRFMAEPVTPAPATIPGWTPPTAVAEAGLQPHHAPDLAPDPCPGRQIGGREAALDRLGSFFDGRGRTYRRAMSSPVDAFEACSRISADLAVGTVSMREAAQAAWAGLSAKTEAGDRVYAASLRSFIGRLHWHCHFIQKLEDAPDLERRELHPAYAGLRPDPGPDDPAFRAWADGRTGFPFVDACMRALIATGWLNFRMRAMVMAFASYHLWLDWRRPAQHLARLFTDFEPGVHYPQAQMQSGTTGVNTARIYNPVKQSRDQDPTGVFIRRWVPELAALSSEAIHEPWTLAPDALAQAGLAIPGDYPEPIVDHMAAARAARERIYAVRQGAAYRAEADAIQDKHGSRTSGVPMRGAGRRRARPAAPDQLRLDLDEA